MSEERQGNGKETGKTKRWRRQYLSLNDYLARDGSPWTGGNGLRKWVARNRGKEKIGLKSWRQKIQAGQGIFLITSVSSSSMTPFPQAKEKRKWDRGSGRGLSVKIKINNAANGLHVRSHAREAPSLLSHNHNHESNTIFLCIYQSSGKRGIMFQGSVRSGRLQPGVGNKIRWRVRYYPWVRRCCRKWKRLQRWSWL